VRALIITTIIVAVTDAIAFILIWLAFFGVVLINLAFPST